MAHKKRPHRLTNVAHIMQVAKQEMKESAYKLTKGAVTLSFIKGNALYFWFAVSFRLATVIRLVTKH
jgi:hypothetical protein